MNYILFETWQVERNDWIVHYLKRFFESKKKSKEKVTKYLLHVITHTYKQQTHLTQFVLYILMPQLIYLFQMLHVNLLCMCMAVLWNAIHWNWNVECTADNSLLIFALQLNKCPFLMANCSVKCMSMLHLILIAWH